MKLVKTLFIFLLVAGGTVSCSNEGGVASDDVRNENTCEGEGCQVVFQFQTPAVGAIATRGVDDSYVGEQGTEKEWNVNNVQIFLFDSQTGLCAKTFNMSQLERAQGTVNGYITYLSKPMVVAQGRYDIFAIANYSGAIDTSTEQQFLAAVDASTYKQGLLSSAGNALVMTNRASSCLAVELTEARDENVVNITLERVVARIDLAKKSDSYSLVNQTGAKYADINLEGFCFINLPRSYYFFRHTAALTSMTEPQWDLYSHFGDIPDANGYVVDPYFFKKLIDANGFTNQDGYYENFSGNMGNGDGVSWTQFAPVSDTPAYKTFYSLENCSMWQAQKNGYSTGVMFKASFTPDNNVYSVGGDGNLVLADPSSYPDSLYFYNYKFYTSYEALGKAGLDLSQITGAEDLDYHKVKHFGKRDGKFVCYYDYWIKHMDNNDPYVMGIMEFAVVRNNLYRLLITSITELGFSTPNIDIDTPDEGETSIKALVNVKPWVVRDQTNIEL